MRIECKIAKCVWKNDDRGIYGAYPISDCDEIELHPIYNNFTLLTNNPCLDEGVIYKLEVEEVNGKYGKQYQIKKNITLDSIDISNLSKEQSMLILSSTTSLSLAKELLSKYPNAIELFLEDRENEIDVSKLKGIKSIRLEQIKMNTKEYMDWYAIRARYIQFDLNNKECKLLTKHYPKEEDMDIILEQPYYVLCDICERPFMDVDILVANEYPNMRGSSQRKAYATRHFLKLNENTCSSKMKLLDLMNELNSYDEYLTRDYDVDRSLFYSDDEYIANINTYTSECIIARRIKSLTNSDNKYQIDKELYRKMDDSQMTDEQLSIIDILNNHSVGLLLGSAGCVDCDTEFFNGKQWKKISEYKDGEMVLQYNQDGSAILVKPSRYIKKDCDEMYHFETKYGVSQTLSDEHNIIYWSKKGIQRNTAIKEIIEKQNGSGWHGKFKTTFTYNGKGIDLTDNEIKLMCAVICDGSFYKWSESKPNADSYMRCRFHIKKERKKVALRQLFDECGIWWKEVQSQTKGYSDFYINSPKREKEFEYYWYDCNAHQMKVVCDNIIQWDGSVGYTKNNVERKSFSSASKKTIDFLQFAFSTIGYRGSVGVDDRVGKKRIINGKEYEYKNMYYDLRLTKRNMVGLNTDNRPSHKKTQIGKIPTKDGCKYCFTVDSGMLVLRKDGKIFITGNSGKSSTINMLVKAMEDNGLTYTLCTPTGTSAKVLSNYTKRTAMTLHKRILAYGEINTDVLIIDECSFIGIDLMDMVVRNVNEYTKIIFVADDAQLPSISCGNVLKDMIDSGVVPIAKLTKVFRYGLGSLSTVATDIRNGKEYLGYNSQCIFDNHDIDNDYQFVNINNKDFEEIVVQKYDSLLEKYHRDDILMMSPYNVGNYGAYLINSVIQDRYNPPIANRNEVAYKKGKYTITLRVGDRVINTVNVYDMLTLEQFNYDDGCDEKSVDIMNGQFGEITNIDNDENVFVKFGEDVVVYIGQEIMNLSLAYCISVHKAQGNQALAVISIIHEQHGRNLNRPLLYVANSRARERLIEIGDPKVINNSLKVIPTNDRKTYLKELLIAQ